MCLKRATGAVALFPLLDFASQIIDQMSTFDEVSFDAYVHLKSLLQMLLIRRKIWSYWLLAAAAAENPNMPRIAV